MLRNIISFFKNWFSIADIFGFAIVSMLICCVWLGYQNSKNIAANARIEAKVKLRSYEKKFDSPPKVEIENKSSDIKVTNQENTKEQSYFEKAREKLNFLNYNQAKEKVKDINNSLTEIVSEVQTEFMDPREISASKNPSEIPAKRIEPRPSESKDSLSPL